MGLLLPFRVLPSSERPPGWPTSGWLGSSSLEVCSPTVCSRAESRHGAPGLPHPRRLTSSGFHNLLTLDDSSPADRVSGRIHSWGSPFRALFLSCSHAPSLAPLPSWRWIADAFRGTETPRTELRKTAELSADPRLQGFAPHENPFPAERWLDRTEARSSPGNCAPPGFSLPQAEMERFSPRLPSRAWQSHVRKSERDRPLLRVLLPAGIGLSLARLPTLLGFLAL